MGGLFSSLLGALSNLFGGTREAKIVIVGLGNAGKTTVLYRVRLGEAVSTQPTMGSNVEEVVKGGVRLECWDLGGQDSLRETWAAYFTNTDGVVLVIDSSNRQDVPKVKIELKSLVANQDLLEAPLLILANKQDVKECLSPAELTQELDLDSAGIRRPYHVQGCCALTGEGLDAGFDWLANAIISTVPKRQ